LVEIGPADHGIICLKIYLKRKRGVYDGDTILDWFIKFLNDVARLTQMNMFKS